MAEPGEKREELPLSKAAQYLVEECRMVLPGIQALFGVQLIVVFSPGFAEKLNRVEHLVHFVAITLIAIAVAIIMTPAALHRASGARVVTETFIRVTTRLLFWSMVPLAPPLCLDFYLIARVIFASPWVVLFALVLFLFFFVMWFVLPRSLRLKRMIR